ncbi:MAG: alginate lyase family protein [Chromatocurvus sp.]
MKAYRPIFRVASLIRCIGTTPPGNVDGDTPVDDMSNAYACARKARALFGERFFVDPRSVAALAGQLEAQYSALTKRLLERTILDRCEGIPLYSSKGPPLGPDFPWGDLPLGPGGDIMYRMRPHRFAFSPRHAWVCLSDPAAVGSLAGMIESWTRYAGTADDTCCYGSNLAVIQRVLALSWSWAFLAGRPEQETPTGLGLEWKILQIIDADIRFLEPRLGHSAPNNHLLADKFASWYLSTVFPELLEGEYPHSAQDWGDELLSQTYPDGGSFEHSSHYHEFACEMGVAYLLLTRRNGVVPASRLRERIGSLLAYQCALTGPECCPLPIGNAIEDTLFPLDVGEAWCAASLRECYRALFLPGLSPAPTSDDTIIRAFWLLGGGLARPPEETARLPALSSFPLAGLYVMSDPELDARLIFRTGPAPGTEVAAGHMHSDLLSIYLNVASHPVLVDAGTYTYRQSTGAGRANDVGWRRYFSGPLAHNGFSVGDEDPLGPISGDFRHRDIPERVPSRSGSDGVISFVEGCFDSDNAYSGMRRLCIHVVGNYWLLVHKPPSTLGPADDASIGFQFAPNVSVQRRAGYAHVASEAGKANMFMSADDSVLEPSVLFGCTESSGGWVSPRYGEKVAAQQLRYPFTDAESVSAFVLTTDPRHAEVRVIETAYRDCASWLVRLESGGTEDLIIVQPATTSSWELEGGHIVFSGEFVWLRATGDYCVSLRWVGASSFEWVGRSVRIRTEAQEPCNLNITRDTNLAEVASSFAILEWPELPE